MIIICMCLVASGRECASVLSVLSEDEFETDSCSPVGRMISCIKSKYTNMWSQIACIVHTNEQRAMLAPRPQR